MKFVLDGLRWKNKQRAKEKVNFAICFTFPLFLSLSLSLSPVKKTTSQNVWHRINSN